MDGRLFADDLVVMTCVEGGPPETEADWRRVADTLRQLHRLTQGWPQRPRDEDRGVTPREGVARCPGQRGLGLITGALVSASDAVITKAYAPIIVLGAVGGAVIGFVVGRWGS